MTYARWVVVAESALAQIYAVPGQGAAWQVVAELSHPESRKHARELTTDTPGRAVDRGGMARHPMSEPHDPKAHEAEVFAGLIAHRLDEERRAGHVTELVLVAEPRFLGVLRGCLSAETRAMVVQEVGKHLTQADPETVAAAVAASG